METDGQHTDKHCLNCSASLPDDAVYCPYCGQKDKDTRVSFWKIVREALLAMFNLDSALLRTLPNLFIPGKLTQEFFRGRQKRYMNPVRLFLWVTIILIAVITLRTGDDTVKIGGEIFDKMKESWQLKKALNPLDSAMLQTQAIFPDQDLTAVFDSIRFLYTQQLPIHSDSINLNENLKVGMVDSFSVTYDDLYTLSPDSILNKYNIEGFWPRIINKQKIKFFVNGTSFGVYFIGKLTWAILLLMPLLALVMKILYIRCDFYYVEHLIFAIHTHTLAFFAFIAAILAEPYLKESGAATGLLFLLVGLYVLVAQKRYYKQNWFKTLLKFALLLMLYNLLIVIVLVVTLIIGFFLF